MIINIRGTSGSGKSTLVRKVMSYYGVIETFPWPNLKRKSKKARGYLLNGGIYIVGSYHTASGGCDQIPKQDTVQEWVEEAADQHDHVIFEGLLTCNSYGRWKEVHDRRPFHFMFLNTPLEDCVEAVVLRRIAKGKSREESQLDERAMYNLTRMYDTNIKTYGKCCNDGTSSSFLDRDESYSKVAELLAFGETS